MKKESESKRGRRNKNAIQSKKWKRESENEGKST